MTDDSSNLWLPSSAAAQSPTNGNCIALHGGLDASVGKVANVSGVTTANGVTNVETGIRFHSCIKKDEIQPANYNYGNFAYEVNMTINEGDCGGIVFRASGQQMYYFVICRNGTYRLVRYKSDSDGSVLLIPASSSSPDPTSAAINTGITVSNTIAVKAKGTYIDLYVNKKQIDSIDDASGYSSGYIGMLAKALTDAVNDPTDVVFSNARVWILAS